MYFGWYCVSATAFFALPERSVHWETPLFTEPGSTPKEASSQVKTFPKKRGVIKE
jgi:hypothetical protein